MKIKKASINNLHTGNLEGRSVHGLVLPMADALSGLSTSSVNTIVLPESSLLISFAFIT